MEGRGRGDEGGRGHGGEMGKARQYVGGKIQEMTERNVMKMPSDAGDGENIRKYI